MFAIDFTLERYRQLLEALQQSGVSFLTYEQYCEQNGKTETNSPYVIMRHDVDLRAEYSVKTAEIEHSLGIRATYYFRIVPQSNKPDCIHAIQQMGHEIGYHYEDMDTAKGDVKQAWESFKNNLEYFRQYYPVRTVCMHGSPRSPYDNRLLWKTYDYHSLSLIGEPYYETDFSRVLYLTDTGRRWDGYAVSRRDKIPEFQEQWTAAGLTYHSTLDIIRAIETGQLHQNILFTTHPQRWTNSAYTWMKEFVLQNIKNIIKKHIA